MGNFIRFLFTKSFLINLSIAILIFLSLVYFALDYLESYTLHGQTIEVPKYEGRLWSDTLGEKDVEFELLISDSIYQKGAKKDMILDQDPKPGKTVKKGRKVYLTVTSTQPPTISMPNLVDLSLRQATSLMEIYGIQIGKLTYRPDFCTNCILEQNLNGKAIEEGKRIERGVKVDLVVGEGLSKELVPVPYIIDMTSSMANILLKSLSLNIGSLNFDETVENAEDSAMARVYKQVPPSSEEPSINMGGAIDLYLTLDTNSIQHSVNPSELN